MKVCSFLAVKYLPKFAKKEKGFIFSSLFKKMLFASTVNFVADEDCNNNSTKLLLLKHIRTTAGKK